jgi:hypothetical protein
MDDLGQFLFLAAGAVSLFTYLSVAHWVNAQTAERQARDRLGVLRKVAEQPTESAKLVLDMLREEEARARELELKREWKARRDGMQFGTILMALGLGLVAMFAIATSRRNWVIGLIPIFVGIVVFAFAAFNRPKDASRA